MAVVTVVTLTVKPDRFADAVESVRKSKAIIERGGGRDFRLLAALVAGEATGSVVVSFEADDFAAYGSIQDKFLADPEGVALISATNTSEGPIAGYQQTLWVDVPL
jgi:hypothetical protein